MSRLSTVARSSFSPARKVRSTVEPVLTFLGRVRTKAEPLPGLTCKNSITVQSWLSTMMVTPLRKSFEEIMSGRLLGSLVQSPRAMLPGLGFRAAQGDLALAAGAQACDVVAMFPDDQQRDERRNDANPDIVEEQPQRHRR